MSTSFEQLENLMKADDDISKLDIFKPQLQEIKYLLLFQFIFSFLGGTVIINFLSNKKILYLFSSLLIFYMFLIYIVNYHYPTIQYWIDQFHQQYGIKIL